MIFGNAKPTVTTEDKDWIEESFLWFEAQYGEEKLKQVPMIEPTKSYFPIEFKGTEENAEQLMKIICSYMDIQDTKIELYYFSDQPLELTDGLITTSSDNNTKHTNFTLGLYSEKGSNNYRIGIEIQLLKNPQNLIATLAHELSHIKLLGEQRINENDEILTDLNTIALGFGIFTANSIFEFQQWHGTTHHGWNSQRRGYIPEQVAAYALALMANYQKKPDTSWVEFLNRSVRKMYNKNMKYLKTTSDAIKFV